MTVFKEASHIILFAHDQHYTIEDYKKVVDVEVSSGHLPAERYDDMLNGPMDLHTAVRLNIDSTQMEGVDTRLFGDIFK